jgi:alpha-L-arabinofuranosidase
MAFASASYLKASGELIVKFVNTADRPLETAIHLKGALHVAPGKAITIAGSPDDVNSIALPTKVAPKEQPLPNTAASFTHTFPPYSVTLLRFPAKQ